MESREALPVSLPLLMNKESSGTTFFYQLYIAVSSGEVWRALVDPEIVSHYHFAPLSILEPCEHGRILHGTPEKPLITGRILCLQEEKILKHTFAFAPGPEKTTVTYTLEAVGDAITRLAVEHTGFTTSDDPLYGDIAGGWPTILSNLKTYLECGRPIAWPWLQGKEFSS